MKLRPIEATSEERHASWFELFFDLIFVVAVSQVAHVLEAHVSVAGAAAFLGLFALTWWSWVGYTFYADRFESNEVAFRLLMMTGMLGVAAFAVNVGGALAPESSTAFVLSYAAVRGVLVVLYARAAWFVPLARDLCVRYVVGFSLGVAIWLASLLVPGALRPYVWTLAFLVELVSPLLAAGAARRVPYDASHIPERFGLFTIIVIGEAVLAAVSGASGAILTPLAAVTAAVGFAVAAAFWWIYFEFVEDQPVRGGWSPAGQIYVYGHYPLVAAVVVAGVGVEHAIAHAADVGHANVPSHALLGAGVALFLASITAIRLAANRCHLLWLRVAAMLAAVVLGVFGGAVGTPWVEVGMLAILVVDIVVESRFGVAPRRTAEAGEGEPETGANCAHVATMRDVEPRTAGCEECLKGKQKWVHLRLCRACGHVGCCDSSPNRHATAHFHDSEHPIVTSLEADEHWSWCYVDETYV